MLFSLLCGCSNNDNLVDEIVIDDSKNNIKSININNIDEDNVINKWKELPTNLTYSVSIKFNDDTKWYYDFYKNDYNVLEVFYIDKESTQDYQYTYYKYKAGNKWDAYFLENNNWKLMNVDVCFPLRNNGSEPIMFRKVADFVDRTASIKIDGYKSTSLNIAIIDKEIYYYSADLGLNPMYTNDRFSWQLQSYIKGSLDYPVKIPKV